MCVNACACVCVCAVSSIFFCYLAFPWLLPFLQSSSRPMLQQWIWGAIMLQLAFVAVGFVLLNDVLGYRGDGWECEHGWGAKDLLYMHPLYNLPHFVLGILGGLLRKAGPSLLGASSGAPQADAQCVFRRLPLPLLLNLCPLRQAVRAKRARAHGCKRLLTVESGVRVVGCASFRWARVVDSLATATAAGAVAFTALTWLEEEMSGEVKYVVALFVQSLLGVPALFFIFGLTADGCNSVASHVLQHPITQWLGGISYSLYLTHWIVHRLALGAFSADESPSYPTWMIPPLLAVALPLAWLVNIVVEEPTRRWLCCLTEPASTATPPRDSAWGSYGSAVSSVGAAAAQTEDSKPHDHDQEDKLLVVAS
jgi:peptidoglycan/LPS O-acetylase OafA/YrhL